MSRRETPDRPSDRARQETSERRRLDRALWLALNDIPRAEVDPITGEVWIPQNLNNTVEYQVNLEYALV